MALADEIPQWRQVAQKIIKMYENYESFEKIVKKKNKSSGVFDFMLKKKKPLKTNLGKLLDGLEDFIDEVSSKSTGEVDSDPEYIIQISKFDKNPHIFEYFLYAISMVRTPSELENYLEFIKNMQLSTEQLKKFSDSLSEIEFDFEVLDIQQAYKYMPSLVNLLVNQDAKSDEAILMLHDWLLGLLDLCLGKIDYKLNKNLGK